MSMKILDQMIYVIYAIFFCNPGNVAVCQCLGWELVPLDQVDECHGLGDGEG